MVCLLRLRRALEEHINQLSCPTKEAIIREWKSAHAFNQENAQKKSQTIHGTWCKLFLLYFPIPSRPLGILRDHYYVLFRVAY